MSNKTPSLPSFKNINSNWRASVFNEMWLREVLLGLGAQTYKIFSEQLLISLPKRSVQESLPLIQEALDEHLAVKLTNERGDILALIGSDTKSGCYDLPFFMSLNLTPEEDYVRSLYKDFGLSEKMYLAQRSKATALTPSFGEVCAKSEGVQRVVICTPVFKRLELLDLYMDYMCNYYVPSLEWSGFEVIFALAGQEEEAPVVRKYFRKGLIYLQTENNLGRKKNLLLNLSRDIQVDYLIYIDSDDFIHPDLTKKMIEVADGNGYWSAVEPFCFFDAKSKDYGLFEGYTKNKDLYGWGMGSGRVFTSKLLKSFGDNPFAHKNKSMDWYIREQLSEVDVPVDNRLVRLSDLSYLPLGLKTEENIWAYDKYKITVLDPQDSLVNWLPPTLKTRYLSISFDQKT